MTLWKTVESQKIRRCVRWRILEYVLFADVGHVIGVDTIKDPMDNASILY